MLVFPAKDQKSIPFLDTAVFSEIQQVVRHTAISGMVLEEENENTIPSWEAWVHVTSKRRAVFTLYLLHWAYSVYHHVPSFNCDELAYIPAPAPKYLWQATEEEQWKDLYERWLAQWQGRQYLQHEFMFVSPGPFLDERTQLWLEDTDEFGMMFMSICKFKCLSIQTKIVAKLNSQCDRSGSLRISASMLHHLSRRDS